MSRLRERTALLDAIPRRYRKDPVAVETLEVLNPRADVVTVEIRDQEARVTIDTGVFRVYLGARPADGDPAVEIAPTMADLQVWFGVVGLLPTLVDGTAAAVNAAALLVDGPLTLESLGTTRLVRWSQPIWRLFDPVARSLDLAGERLAIALAQLNLLTSAADFADYWGVLTDTFRRTGETDETFTARQLHELIRPRSNNEALAQLLEEDFGVPVVEVRDLERDIFRCSRTPLRGFPLAGRIYNAATAEVVFDDVAPVGAVVAAAFHVAAGVTVFVRDVVRLETAVSPYFQAGTPMVFGSPPAMKINHPDGTIGIGKIGPP